MPLREGFISSGTEGSVVKDGETIEEAKIRLKNNTKKEDK